MTPSQELKLIVKKQRKVVDDIASDLYSELIEITPVVTGQLKSAWDLDESNSGWIISNNMTYASIIFDGRGSRPSGGKYNLPDGITPILKKYNILLQERLNRIRV